MAGAAQGERRSQPDVHVRGVGAEEDPPRWDEREQRPQVRGVPPGRVEVDVGVVGQLAPEPGEVGDAGVGEDDRRPAVAPGQIGEGLSKGADPCAGVNQDRRRRLCGGGEDPVDVRVLEPEVLAARVQLDPAGARRQRVGGLAHAAEVRVEPRERHQDLGVAGGLLDDPAVLLLVAALDAEREDRRAAAEGADVPRLLLAGPGRAVEVGAGVRVDVEQGQLAGPERRELRGDRLGDAQRALARSAAASRSTSRRIISSMPGG